MALTAPDCTISPLLTELMISKESDTAVVLLVMDNMTTNLLSSTRVISCLKGSALVVAKIRSISLPSQSVSQPVKIMKW